MKYYTCFRLHTIPEVWYTALGNTEYAVGDDTIMPFYDIQITDEAEADLAYYRANERRLIIDGIITQLTYEPTKETSNRKRLRTTTMATWELRIGKYRVFYEVETDVDLQPDDTATVIIVSVGHKEHNVLYIRGKVVKV
ncbi:MAG: type II toxin-antitoxin system RelE/ParE family toxin [Kiritimatiellales bacterium]